MKNVFIILLLALPLSLSAQTAKIKIDVDRTIGEIDPKIYGVFMYSLNGVEWKPIGNTLQMSYTLPHFMGYRFALFNYATITTGGHVDFYYFRIDNSLNGSAAIEGINENIPTGFNIHENYPNPFNSVTQICYDVPTAANVCIHVYDIIGRYVRTLVNQENGQGHYTVTFDASSLASGLYLYRMNAGNFIETHRMMLLK